MIATPRQVQIMEVIHELSTREGYAPSLEELSDELCMRSPGGVVSGLQSLMKKGLLTWRRKAARSIRLTPAGINVICHRRNEVEMRLHARAEPDPCPHVEPMAPTEEDVRAAHRVIDGQIAALLEKAAKMLRTREAR